MSDTLTDASLVAAVRAIPWVMDKERDLDVALESYYLRGLEKRFFRLMGVDLSVRHALVFDDGRIFFDANELDEAMRYFSKMGDGVGVFLSAATKRFLKLCVLFKKDLALLRRSSPEGASRKTIARQYTQFAHGILSLIPYSYSISTIMEEHARLKITEHLQLIFHNSDCEHAYLDLMISLRKTKTSREYGDRLLLACAPKATEDSRALKNHIRKYGWLSCYRPTDEPMTLEAVRSSVIALQAKDPQNEIRKVVREEERRKRRATLLFRKAQFPKHLSTLVTWMRYNIWVRTYRRELMNYAFFCARPLHRAIARMAAIDFGNIRNFAEWEFEQFLDGAQPLDAATASKREYGFAFVRMNSQMRILTGKMKKMVEPKKKHYSQKPLTGTSVTKGVIRGNIFIVKSQNDLALFPHGSILLAPTVATWMTPAVERCAGIITDAGGVLSHTAIIAREYRKPCIIATKIATQILKDGDCVEIDANKGTVRKV